MKRLILIVALIAPISLTESWILAQGKDAERLLQAGKNKETLDRDLPGAIAFYQQAFKAAEGTNRPVAARALLRLGVAYKKQNDEKARTTLLTLINTYGDQKDVVNEARGLLDSMTEALRPKIPKIHRLLTGDYADSSAHITFDGRYMVRTDWNSGGLAIREMATELVTRLKVKTDSWGDSDAYASNPILSPDGKQVVYMWYPDNKEGPSNYQLRTMEVNGAKTSRVLVDRPDYCCFQPIGWGPDGRIFLTISRGDGTWEIATITLADPTVKRLRSMGWRLRRDRPSLSPDGKYLAYSALAENPPSAVGRAQKLPASARSDQYIYVLPTTGAGDETPLVRGANINESPVWTRDGKHVLFVTNRSSNFELYSIKVEGGAPDGIPSLVPMNIPGRSSLIGMTSSDFMYYVPQDLPGGFDVFIADLGGVTPLVNTLSDWNRAPAWSPDGANIAFKRRHPNQNNAVFDLVVYNLKAQNEKIHALRGLDNTPPVWFHDGKSILLHRKLNGKHLIRLDTETGDITRIQELIHAVLPANYGAAVLSPDDKTLYLAVAPAVPAELRRSDPKSRIMTIVAIDMETGDRKEIWRNTGPSLILHSIAVSPDGKALAMTLNREGWESPRLARLDVETKEYMELASSVAESMVAWTRDGRSILFAQVGPDEGRVMRVSVDDTRRLEFTGLVLSQSCGCGHTIDFNPDGSRIVFSDATREKNALYALENVSAALKSSR